MHRCKYRSLKLQESTATLWLYVFLWRVIVVFPICAGISQILGFSGFINNHVLCSRGDELNCFMNVINRVVSIVVLTVIDYCSRVRGNKLPCFHPVTAIRFVSTVYAGENRVKIIKVFLSFCPHIVSSLF